MGAYQLEVEHWGLPRVALVLHHMTLLVTSLREDFRIEYKPDSWLKLVIIHPMLNKVRGGHTLYGAPYFNEESLHTKFETPSTILSC